MPTELLSRTITFYTLRNKNTKFYPNYNIQVNFESDLNVPVSYFLEFVPFPKRLWLVDSKDVAERAKASSPWYEAGFETPSHNQYIQDLEVVEINILPE